MITKKVATFIAGTDYNDIPGEAVSVAKKCILDCIGVALAGSVEPAVSIVEEYLKEIGGVPEAVVIGRGFKTSAPNAALINGVTAHVLDYDDVSWTWQGHPSVAVLPAVLALGERYDVSGKRIIESYVTGLEVGAKISLGLAGHYEVGWHATATIGTMAATAAAARLLGLDVSQTQMALGIATSMASGTRQNFGTMTKPFHAGKAASNGVTAACLAEKGFTADANILEAGMGLAGLMSGSREYNTEKMAQNLGTPFDIIEKGLTLKPYPCCRFTHRCLDAILYLKNKHRIKAGAVAEVICRTSPFLPTVLIHSLPTTGAEAKFSMQYCMAVALIDGKAGLAQFADRRVNKADGKALVTRVKYEHPNQTGSVNDALLAPEEVVVRLRSGEEYSHVVTIGKGDPQNPMSAAEVSAKFRDCTSRLLSPPGQERLLELLLNLESLKRVSELAKILSLENK